MKYKSYSEFAIECFGMFVITYRSYEIYCEYCLENNYYYFGYGNEHSLHYNYKQLVEKLTKNLYV